MKIKLSNIKSYYVNLPEEVAKNDALVSEISSLGYTDLTRIDGVRIPGMAHGGIAKVTHELFSNINELPIILFEDDARPINYIDEIDIPDDADAVYLGVCQAYEPVRYNRVVGYPGVYRVFNPLGRHAVLYLKKDYLDSVSHLAHLVYTQSGEERLRSLDWAVHRLMGKFKVYAITPVFYQHNDSQPRMSNLSRIINMDTLEIDPIEYNYTDRYPEYKKEGAKE
jgi:hypothetical protein